jgi:phenylpropionate dioxygenase-like ring-hydroxylating dioxygenase large terminal subunit
MGDMMRQYWIPAMKADELPSPDCPPVRVKLLGEELIGYRTTSGAVGLMQNSCPHRGASMFFGRNEEEGLRCVYHGWKFDTTGACVDMPSEPAESNFRSKVKARAYPCIDRNGVIWAYMGPKAEPPELPQLEGNMHADYSVTILHRPNNWMQGIEGELDTIHAAFLHGGANRSTNFEPGTFGYYQSRSRDGKFSVRETDYGTSYGMYREAEEDSYYWRIGHFLFPFYAMPPGASTLGQDARVLAYVPMDDYHTLEWSIGARLESASDNYRAPQRVPGLGRDYLPNGTGWYDRYNITQNAENDYLIDREAQKNWKSYTGIEGIRQQDMAMTESMGAIMDRTREHLGTTDALIIRTRRRLIAAAKALRNEGVLPPGVEDASVYLERSGQIVLPRNVDWWQATEPLRKTFGPLTPETVPAIGTNA